MKLISSFGDYYDSLFHQYNSSDQHFWLRKEKLIKIDKTGIIKEIRDISWTATRIIGYYGLFYVPCVYVVGFCGKIYTAISSNDLGVIFMDDNKRLNELKEQYKLNFDPAKYLALYKQVIEKYITHSHYIEANSPYFFAEFNFSSQITTMTLQFNFNSLRWLNFQRVVDPWTAYQEINLFVNSVMTVRDEPQQITDSKVLLAAKGFDPKYGFRRLPTKNQKKERR